jgi:hypothetical protein
VAWRSQTLTDPAVVIVADTAGVRVEVTEGVALAGRDAETFRMPVTRVHACPDAPPFHDRAGPRVDAFYTRARHYLVIGIEHLYGCS